MRRTDRPGFTLIELFVVIAVIAILAAILFPVEERDPPVSQEPRCPRLPFQPV